MGDPNDEVYVVAAEKFGADLVAAIEELNGGFVQSYVLVASTETVAGVERWFYNTHAGQSSDRSLGLLESAAASERYAIVHTFPASGFLFDGGGDDY